MAKFCSECGKPVDAVASFCSACGAALASSGASNSRVVTASVAPQVGGSLTTTSTGRRTAVLLALVVVGVLAVVHFSKDSGTSESTHIWPQEVVTNFENACIGGDSIGRTVYCSCALVKLQKRYSAEEFALVESGYLATGRLPAEVLTVVTDCAPALSP